MIPTIVSYLKMDQLKVSHLYKIQQIYYCMNSFFPYDKFREGQERIYTAIIDSPQAVLVNAPTGIGKTITSLSAMLERRKLGDKIIICVKTINQVEPLLREWKKIKSYIDRPLTILPLLGRERICGVSCIVEHKGKKAARLDWKTFITTLNDLFLGKQNTEVMQEYLREQANQLQSCAKLLMDKLLGEADIVVTTYPFLENGLFESLLKRMHISIDQSLILVDEAHNLIDQRVYTISNDDLELIEGVVGELPVSHLLREAMYSIDATIESIPKKLCRETLELLSNIESDEVIKETRDSIAEFLENRYYGLLKFSAHSAYLFDVFPSRYLSKFQQARMQIYQSATFYDLNPVTKLFGLPEETEKVDLINPHDIPFNQLRLWMDDVSSAIKFRNSFNISRYAMRIKFIHAHSPRHTLVLCPSYEFIEALRVEFIEEILIVETSTSTTSEISDQIVGSFVPRIILANQQGKLFEGVEWTTHKASMVSTVVLAGLGTYAPDGDEVIENWKAKLYGKLNSEMRDHFLYRFPLHTAVIQGFGRAIRRDADRGALVVLDYRADDFLVGAMHLKRVDQQMLAQKFHDFFMGYPQLWQLKDEETYKDLQLHEAYEKFGTNGTLN